VRRNVRGRVVSSGFRRAALSYLYDRSGGGREPSPDALLEGLWRYSRHLVSVV